MRGPAWRSGQMRTVSTSGRPTPRGLVRLSLLCRRGPRSCRPGEPRKGMLCGPPDKKGRKSVRSRSTLRLPSNGRGTDRAGRRWESSVHKTVWVRGPFHKLCSFSFVVSWVFVYCVKLSVLFARRRICNSPMIRTVLECVRVRAPSGLKSSWRLHRRGIRGRAWTVR